MDTFNLMNTLWSSANPNNNPNNPSLLNPQFHNDSSSATLPNNMPPPHFFMPSANKLMECPTFNTDHSAASLMNVTCDLQDLLNRLNANSSASALATQTQIFEAKHSTDMMASEQTVLPSCSNTNLFQTSALSTSTSSLLSENLHDQHEAKHERAVLPQSAGFPSMPTQFDDQQHFSSNSSPGSSSLASTFLPMFPIMSTADNFLGAALTTLLSSHDPDSEFSSDSASKS